MGTQRTTYRSSSDQTIGLNAVHPWKGVGVCVWKRAEADPSKEGLRRNKRSLSDSSHEGDRFPWPIDRALSSLFQAVSRWLKVEGGVEESVSDTVGSSRRSVRDAVFRPLPGTGSHVMA